MKTVQPNISVIIPAYNEERYLAKCLQALRNQDSSPPFEIIIINNNSTDRTVEIAKSFNTQIIHETKQGLIFAKQAGCKKAQGEIISVLDADNVPPTSYLKTIDELLKNQKIAAVTGPYIMPSNAPWWAKLHAAVGIIFIGIWQTVTGNSPHIWGGNVAFRKVHFDKFGGYDTSFTFAADEVKLRKDLKEFGRILHDRRLAVVSSARRFKKGFFYFYIKFLLKGYIFNYISTLVFKKPISRPEDLREE